GRPRRQRPAGGAVDAAEHPRRARRLVDGDAAAAGRQAGCDQALRRRHHREGELRSPRTIMADRQHMQKPDFLTDAEWEYLKEQTSSLQRIRSDGKADVEAYLANPDGRAEGKG